MYRLKYSVRKSKRKGNLQFDGLLGGKDQPHIPHPSWTVIIPLIRSPYFQYIPGNTFAHQDIWVYDISMVFQDNFFRWRFRNYLGEKTRSNTRLKAVHETKWQMWRQDISRLLYSGLNQTKLFSFCWQPVILLTQIVDTFKVQHWRRLEFFGQEFLQ